MRFFQTVAALMLLIVAMGCATRAVMPSAMPVLDGNVVMAKSQGYPQVFRFAQDPTRGTETSEKDVALIWRCVKLFAENRGVLFTVSAGVPKEEALGETLFTNAPLCLILEGKRYRLERLSKSLEEKVPLHEHGAGYMATLPFLEACARARTIEFEIPTSRGLLRGSFSEDTMRSFHAFPEMVKGVNLGIETQDENGKWLGRVVEWQPTANEMVAVFRKTPDAASKPAP